MSKFETPARTPARGEKGVCAAPPALILSEISASECVAARRVFFNQTVSSDEF